MKNYFLDRLLLMNLLILGCVLSWIVFPAPEALSSSIILFVCLVIFCKRILLVPVDLLAGKRTKIVYFSTVLGGEQLRFNSKYHCSLWKFYYGSKSTIVLLNRDVKRNYDVFGCKTPPQNKKIKITYWKYSGILLCWAISAEDMDVSVLFGEEVKNTGDGSKSLKKYQI